MARRFFCEHAIDSQLATLASTEAHHLQHVLRAKVGDQVDLFDGHGSEFTAEVTTISRNAISLKIIERREIDREAATTLTLAVSLPKGDRQKWLVEKCTELGVARLIPLATQRGVAQPTANALDRLRRAVVEASKQCGRNQLMEIQTPQPWTDFSPHGLALVAHPYAVAEAGSSQNLSTIDTSQTQAITVAIGPEGGFTDEEVSRKVRAGWHTFSLGPRILRIETAALAVAAQLLAEGVD